MIMSETEFQKNFRLIVERIFNSWQNLRLAVEHGMGGRNGQQVAIDIMDYTYQYCIMNENITQGELQDVVEDLMDQEFNTLCEDGSIPEICANLIRYKQLSLEGKYAEIENELSKLPPVKEWLRPDVKISYTPIDADSSCDEDYSDDGDDMELDEDENEEPSCSRITRSQTRGKQTDFVEPEEGWTTVRTRRK